MSRLTPELVQEAIDDLQGRVRTTPLEHSPQLSLRAGVPVLLKLECLQLTGSFKVRGAVFALRRLAAGLEGRRIVTCSAGNHGWAVAFAAAELDLPVTIYVPASIDSAKLAGIRALGATVVVSEASGYDDALAQAVEAAGESGDYYLSAYDDPLIMAANGGALAAEVLEQMPEAATFLLPVGGGGLAAGFSMWALHRQPEARIIGCQLAASPALQLSLSSGEAVTRLPGARTVAGGLEGGLGRHTFAELKGRINEVALVSEGGIRRAVRWLMSEHRYLVEPSGAVGVAACLADSPPTLDGPTVIVLSGRNVAVETLAEILG